VRQCNLDVEDKQRQEIHRLNVDHKEQYVSGMQRHDAHVSIYAEVCACVYL